MNQVAVGPQRYSTRLKNASDLWEQFQTMKLSDVPRKANTMANGLARYAKVVVHDVM